MSSTTTKPPSRSRRRLAAWLAFGAAGLATGAVWATGFNVIGTSTGTDNPAAIIPGSQPPTLDADLKTAIKNPTGLQMDWNGLWGTVANQDLFTVDLDAHTGDYNVAFLLTNGVALRTNNSAGTDGFASLQLEVSLLDAGPAGDCSAATFGGDNSTPVAGLNNEPTAKIMAFDRDDAGVYWNGLSGGTTYCLGISLSDGQDRNGTFIRRQNLTAPSVDPDFIATVDHSA